MALLGLIFHYMIAFWWTYLFYFVYPKWKLLSMNIVLTGVGYGLVVWFCMNRIVLPLSSINMRPFDLSRAAVAAAILMIAIGIPLSYLAKQHYSKEKD